MFDRQERFAPKTRFLVGSLVLIVVAALVTGFTAFAERQSAVPIAIPGLPNIVPADVGGPQTVLLIGADRRSGDKKLGLKPRSDTMMLVRLNPDKQVTTVLSIPRDLRVKIPGHGSDKFNAAFTDGGAKAVIDTIHEAFGINVNRVAVVDFLGFAKAVDAIGCVYIDVDRHYFHANTGLTYAESYAAIDIKAGYQKICGYRALDYVRARHVDSDIYREARQQGFVRQAKQQVGVGSLVTHVPKLKKILRANIRTDRGLASGKRLQKFLNLAASSAGKPVYQVEIPKLTTPMIGGVSYVVAPDSSLRLAAKRFMNGPTQKAAASGETSGASQSTTVKREKRSATGLPSSMSYAKAAGQQQALLARVGIRLPVFYPAAIVNGATYQSSSTRSYTMKTGDGKRVSAYRIVAKLASGDGDYYGIQGVNWNAPPILKNPSETRKIRGREYQLYYEGNKLALVAFHRGTASYWVSNTLMRKLNERQMIALATSLRLSGS